MIIADKREKNSIVIAELKARGIEVKEETLNIGDYIIGNTIIERKSFHDFITSMINKRLIKQLGLLKESNFENKLMIIEGLDESDFDDFDRRDNLNKAKKGMILSITLDYKIPILLTKNAINTADYLEVLHKRIGKKKTEISLLKKPKFLSLTDQQEFVLESFPGIGKITAREILKKFKTIKQFINAPEEELSKIKKLGRKKARIIKRIINSDYISKDDIQNIQSNLL